MGLGHSPKIVTNGLIGLWDASNARSYPGSGTTVSNLLGGGYNFGMVGTPTYQNGYFTSFSDTNYFTMTNSFPTPGTGDFTYSFWVYIPSTATSTILEIRNPSTTFIVRNFLSGNPFYINFSAAQFGLSFANAPAAGSWYNLVVKRSGSTVTGYSNGVASTNSGTTSLDVSGSEFRIGRLSLAGGQAFAGNFAIFSAYNRAITDQEALQNFNANRGRYGV